MRSPRGELSEHGFMHAGAAYRWARLRARAGDGRHAMELLERATAMGHAAALFRVGVALLGGGGNTAATLSAGVITGSGTGTGSGSGKGAGTGTGASVSLADPMQIRIGDRGKNERNIALGFESVARAARGGHIQVLRAVCQR
jgi:hypothetical protein